MVGSEPDRMVNIQNNLGKNYLDMFRRWSGDNGKKKSFHKIKFDSHDNRIKHETISFYLKFINCLRKEEK